MLRMLRRDMRLYKNYKNYKTIKTIKTIKTTDDLSCDDIDKLVDMSDNLRLIIGYILRFLVICD